MTRPERIAKMERDLVELRACMQRIEHETFCAKRNVDELIAELRSVEQPDAAEPVAKGA